MMPQSLTVDDSTSAGSSAKRQRSADSREVSTRALSTGPNSSNGSPYKSVVKIPKYLDKSKLDIASAFQDLEWKQRFRLFHALENPATSPYRVDRSEVVINRNRYGNVQPWDNSRVRLEVPTDGSDYVNASPIVLKSRGPAKIGGDQPAAEAEQIFQESRYISTQGPKEGTISHFWQMVMQESTGEVGVVVMLTQCYEANKEKCSQYFPAKLENPTMFLSSPRDNDDDKENVEEINIPSSFSTVTQDAVTLKTLSEDAATGSQVRTLELTIGNKVKTIYHYLFEGWPDFGKPNAEERLALLELSRRTKTIAGDSPRIVHCSAGVGRTGTFIALDFLVREIEEGRLTDTTVQSDVVDDPAKKSIYKEVLTPTTETWGKSGPLKAYTPTVGDFPSGEENSSLKDDLVYETVNALRDQRMMMVMNDVQYSFIYEVVREVFMDKYKARPEGAVVKGLEEGPVDLPRGKVVRVGAEGQDLDEGASGSEAETEIMEGDIEARKRQVDAKLQHDYDPYDVVAPEHIREGLSKEQ